ncbi:hypothetical protein [Flavobacterium sp. FlaQc-50]|uniref:hypothetical protein n=1 Tax=unclassified Flavobacterium TaxID=196869 RepID=UPI003756EF40
MEAKYYTPEFQEFHEGFEYVDNLFHVDTVKMFTYKEVDGWRKSFFLKGIDNKQIRVKCLDREDIESLGWSQIGHDTYALSGNLENYELEFDPDYKTYIYETSFRKENFFKGEIKNKSELRKIMLQTGILQK